MRTFVLGTMALVDGVVSQTSATGGKDGNVRMRFTEVYAKRDGRWLCVTQYVAPAP
jgi:ketosteroid isomerase-like protein